MPSCIHNSAAGSFIRRFIQLVAVPHPVWSIKSLSWHAPFSVCSAHCLTFKSHGLMPRPDDTDNWLAFAISQPAVSISNNFCPLQVAFCVRGIVRFGGTCPLYFYYGLCLLLVRPPTPRLNGSRPVSIKSSEMKMRMAWTLSTHVHTHMAPQFGIRISQFSGCVQFEPFTFRMRVFHFAEAFEHVHLRSILRPLMRVFGFSSVSLGIYVYGYMVVWKC